MFVLHISSLAMSGSVPTSLLQRRPFLGILSFPVERVGKMARVRNRGKLARYGGREAVPNYDVAERRARAMATDGAARALIRVASE